MARKRPGEKPKQIRLKRHARRKLEALARSYHKPAAVVLRAKAILALADDPCVSAVARRLGLSRKSVTRYRDNFLTKGVKGLQDKPRTGRPVEISMVERCEVIAIACARPADIGILHRPVWTYEAIQYAYLVRNPDRYISRTSVIRILNKADIRPHRVYYWLHSPDPLFRKKVTELCTLYLNPPPGVTVLCVDEKPGIQALARKHPTKVPGPGRSGKYEYEYKRNGTRKLLAAFNPQSGEVYGEMRESRTGNDLVEFMEEIARRHPKGDVHIIWDNLNIHYNGPTKRWDKFNARNGNRFHFHYTPLHASWVNQIECWFSILQKRVISLNSFQTLEELDVAVRSFIDYWNLHEKKPFNWTFRGYPGQIAEQVAA
jgi:transposase